MRDKVLKIWPEISWIENTELREKVLIAGFMQLKILFYQLRI